MYTYTVVALSDGQRIGGQSDATLQQVWDLLTDERGLDTVAWHRLMSSGGAMSVSRYKVFPTDERETVSILIIYRNEAK